MVFFYNTSQVSMLNVMRNTKEKETFSLQNYWYVGVLFSGEVIWKIIFIEKEVNTLKISIILEVQTVLYYVQTFLDLQWGYSLVNLSEIENNMSKIHL